MTYKQHIARLVTGDITLRSMPEIALQALEQGLDTPSLRILAGLSEDENEFVLDRYIKATLQELSIAMPNKRQAAIEVGLAIAGDILDGKRDVFQGVQDIKWKAIDAYPFYEETTHYCYDSIGFDKVYGLFVLIEDLRDSGRIYLPELTQNEEEVALTKKLLEELKAWTKRMENGS